MGNAMELMSVLFIVCRASSRSLLPVGYEQHEFTLHAAILIWSRLLQAP